MDAELVRIEIHCESCGEWFPSTLPILSHKPLPIGALIGSERICPFCKSVVCCNKQNMRLWSSERGAVDLR
jgi:hypothetical protein